MTTEQKKSIRLTIGNLEESVNELQDMEDQLQREWDGMTGKQQEDNPDLEQLICEIENLKLSVSYGIQSTIERLEDAG